uniref:Uncharacterized protein n=1 Tax=Megaselia scalaris TaxID=36166 RepID=T1GXW5_MEGSC
MIKLARQAGAKRPLFDGARWEGGHKLNLGRIRKEIGLDDKTTNELCPVPISKDKLLTISGSFSSSAAEKRGMFSKRERSDDNGGESPAKSQSPSTSFHQSEKGIVVGIINENIVGNKVAIDLWKKVEMVLIANMIKLARQAGTKRPLFDGAR